MSLMARGLTKSFGGERALDGVDLEIADGEIHALLGPNGSGKSTLIGCLSGRLAPDSGEMVVAGEPVERFSPRSAFAAGTAVIYQHFSLVPTLNVRDNVFLGSEQMRATGIDRRSENDDTRELLAIVQSSIDPGAKVSSLSVGQKQLVEIAKALRHRPKLLVLDEPTAALSEAEATVLGVQLRRLRESGLAILYVTHLLGEVFQLADRVTVLRDGRVALSKPIDELDRARVIEAISPRGGVSTRDRTAESTKANPVLLDLDGFEAQGVGPIDLQVAEGEVVALFGLLGAGRSELLEGLYGIRGPTAGEVTFAGRPFAPRSPRRSLDRGIALVPADRASQSIFASRSALDNLLLPSFAGLSRGFLRSRQRERSSFGATAAELRLVPPRAGSQARTFSGGNQQKLAVGRWLTKALHTRLLLLDEPTQGIDVGARGDMYELIRSFVSDEGRAALFTSSDPEEVEALADRVLVLVRGQIVAELRGHEINAKAMLGLAHGSSDPETQASGERKHVD
jgi:ribose transport system ATP-binding protein